MFFTYNDAPLLHGLLASVQAWSVQPDEIVLLDDGSDEPFRLADEEKQLPVRLLRHERNLGFTRSKHDCLCAATGDFIWRWIATPEPATIFWSFASIFCKIKTLAC